MNATPTEPDLTFHWPAEGGFPLVLFVCVVGSLFAHAATFFLFQVVYPQRVTIPQPAPHVSLLTPSSPENIALLRWIEAEDPALIARDNAVSPPALAEVRYRPSFAAPRTAPLGAPEEKAQDVRFPPPVDRLAAAETAPAANSSGPTRDAPTSIHFAGSLASRPLAQNPPLQPLRRAFAPINPTVLLIGVTDEGEIRYQFIQQTSGSAPLDEVAADHLLRLRFAPGDAAITWAHATFAWGADVYSPTPNSDLRAPSAR